ncbi:MAG TPA: hypothetical protein VFY36_00680, partial [Solirubrobacteraceae bacterium]|nr:hypothetical protein [Solirubrobacteraceae bacterium]
MKRIRYAGLALVIVGALGVTIASTAVAHTFNSDVMASLKGSADATQVFTTAAGKVECKKILVIVGVTGLTVKTLIVIIIYEECKAFGLAATVSPAEYEFDADGTASVLKEITIKAVACEVKVPGGAANAK